MDVLGTAFIDIRARTANFDRQLTAATRTGMTGAAGAVATGSRAIEAESATAATAMSSRFGTAATNIEKKMTGAFGGMRRSMGAFLPSMKLALPAAVIAAGVATVHMAGDFQTATTQLVTGAGESQKALGMVSAGLLHMSADVGAKATDLAHGLYMIESAGFHGAKGLNVLQKSAEGAKVGAADMETVADAVTTALNAYGRPASDAAKVTNTLIETVKAGKTHLQDLAGSLGQVLPNAAALHIPFEQVAAAMATMTAQGTNANKASTSLRFLFNALVAPTSSAKTELKHFGLTSVEVGNDLTKKGLGPALKDVTDAVEKKFPRGSAQYVAAVSHMVGGTRGMTAALELTGKHTAKFGDNVKTITDRVHHAGGEISGWGKIQQTFNQRLDVAKAQLEDLGIKIGNKLLPEVSNITIALGNFADGLDGTTKHATGAGDAGIMVGRVWNEQVKPALLTAGHIIQSVTGFFSAHITVVKAVVAAYIGYKTAVIALRVTESVASGISRMSGAMATGSNAAGRLAGSTSSVAARLAGGAGAGALGGPVGIAMTAALTLGTIAIGHFMHKNAEAKAKVDALAGSLDEQTGAITRNTRVTVAKSLQDDGTFKTSEKYGISIRTVTSAALGNAAAQAKVLAQVKALHDANKMSDFDAARVLVAIGKNSDALDEAKRKNRELADATGQTAHAVKKATQEQVDAHQRALAAFDTFGKKSKLTSTQFISDMKSLPKATADAITGLVASVDNGKAKAGPAAHRLAKVMAANVPPDMLTKAGRDLVNGLIAGVNEREAAFEAKSRELASAGHGAFVSWNKISSPSKVYEKSGRDIVAGLIKGITGGKDGLRQAVEFVSLALHDAVAHGTAGIRHTGGFRVAEAVARNFATSGRGTHDAKAEARDIDGLIAASRRRITQLEREKSDVKGSGKAADDRRTALEKSIRAEQDHVTSLESHKKAVEADGSAASKAADNAKAAWEKIVGVYRDSISKVNASLQSYIQARNSMRNSIATSLIGTADLAGFGTTSPEGILTGLTRQDRSIHAFQRDIGVLRKRGLSRRLINQLSAAGLDAAPMVHRLAMSASSSEIDRINRLNKDIVSTSRGFGQSVADATYGRKIDRTNEHLHHLRGELRDLKSEVKQLRHDTQAVGKDTADELNGVARHAHHRGKRP